MPEIKFHLLKQPATEKHVKNAHALTQRPFLSGLRISSWGQAIQLCRKERNMSHHELATAVGVAKGDVRDWESNVSIPKPTTLKRLYGALSRMKHFTYLLPAEASQPDGKGSWVPPQAPLAEIPEELAERALHDAQMPKNFAEALRRTMDDDGLGRQDLADILQVPVSAVQAWCAGLKRPGPGLYRKILTLLPELSTAPQPAEHIPIEEPPPTVREPAPPAPEPEPEPVHAVGWGNVVAASNGQAPHQGVVPDDSTIRRMMGEVVKASFVENEEAEEEDGDGDGDGEPSDANARRRVRYDLSDLPPGKGQLLMKVAATSPQGIRLRKAFGAKLHEMRQRDPKWRGPARYLEREIGILISGVESGKIGVGFHSWKALCRLYPELRDLDMPRLKGSRQDVQDAINRFFERHDPAAPATDTKAPEIVPAPAVVAPPTYVAPSPPLPALTSGNPLAELGAAYGMALAKQQAANARKQDLETQMLVAMEEEEAAKKEAEEILGRLTDAAKNLK